MYKGKVMLSYICQPPALTISEKTACSVDLDSQQFFKLY